MLLSLVLQITRGILRPAGYPSSLFPLAPQSVRGCYHCICSLAPFEGELNRCQQHHLTERLEKAFDCTSFKHKCANGVVATGGDKDNRNLLMAKVQFPL